MKIRRILFQISLIIFSMTNSACNFVSDAKQTTTMAKDFEEEGRLVAKEVESIRQRATSVDSSDGVSAVEAKALVEKLLLDGYRQFLGWQINIQDDGDFWDAECRFVGNVENMKVDKKTGSISFQSNSIPKR